MEDASIWIANVKTAALGLLSQFIAYLPSLLGAFLLLTAGWLVARLTRAMSVRVSDWFNRLLDTVVPTGQLASFRLSPRVIGMIGNAVFWLIMFCAVTIAADVAEMETFSDWLKSAVRYLPDLLGGGFIILAGYVISAAVRDLVSTTLASVEIGQSELIGAAAQWATFLTAVIVGIDQVGVDVTFLIVVITIVVGSILGGMALAFGLGARPLATNLIGVHYLQQQYSPGQVVAIGEVEGQILEFSATGIVLDTADGRTTVPGDAYFKNKIIVKGGEVSDD